MRFEAFLEPGPEHDFYRVLSFLEAEPGSLGGPSVTFAVAFAEAEHSVPAVLTRFSSADRSLVYTGDTGPGRWFSRRWRPTPMCCWPRRRLRRTTSGVYHMTPAQAGEVAAAAGGRSADPGRTCDLRWIQR